MDTIITTTATPTREAYAELQGAYDHFNARLFEGKLPPCLITLQRKDKRVMGYYSPERFGHRIERRMTDEIAMNPMHFQSLGDLEALQTLAHEMCHLWQQHFGTPSRKAYHNAEWAEKMEAIGLMPSSTGQPGGKKTGQRMGDYPIAGGAFEAAAEELLGNGFRLSWYDRAEEIVAKPPSGPASGQSDGEGGEGEGGAETAPTASGKRVKFTCGGCGANAWGKASLKIVCGECLQPFTPAT